MMITPYSDADNMQDDMGIPLVAASSFSSRVALAPCQIPISDNRASDRALASLWIQRLKPRDELEGFNPDKFSSIEKKHHMISKEQEINAVEKQQSMCEHGRGRVISSYILSNSGGFEQIQGATSERPTISVKNSRYTSEVLQTSSRAVEGRISVSHGAQAEGSTFAGKPPLPRMHGKCGFLPRHPGYTSQGFSSSSACRITSSATDGGVLATAPRITSSASKESSLTVKIPKGPLLKEGHHAQNVFDHGFVATKEEENGKLGVTQATLTSVLNPPKRSGSQDSNVMAITLLETPRLKNLNGLEPAKLGGVIVQSAQRGGELAGSFLTERNTSKPAVDCRGRSPKADKTLDAASNATNTVTFPWEMFAEAGGPSRSARQEFVEVYNRARNELKNQKASSLVTKVADNDAESHPGGGTYVQSTSFAVHEGQNSGADSQLKMLENLEHVSQPEVLPKRQHCVRMTGEVTKKGSQAYGSVHVAGGKDSSSVLHGQPAGAFHRYAEPSSVALRGCSMTVGESSGFRRGFASSRAPGQCNQTVFTHKELSQPKRSGETDAKPMDIKAPMLLSKRQAGYFDGSTAVVTGKESVKQRENSPSRTEIWLQRWYPSHSNSHEPKLLKLDRREPDPAGRFDVLTEATERDSKKRLIEKGIFLQRVVAEAAQPERSKPCSGRVLPSAAAMAIVGAAAHQFCTMQPKSKKDSFTFWSGVGIPAPQYSKSFAERGQKRPLSESKPSSKC